MPPSADIDYVMIAEQNDDPTASSFYRNTKEIATYVIKKQLNQKQKSNRIGEKLHELCLDMKVKHEPFFDSLKSRLSLSRETIEECSQSVMGEVLEDGCNFGRVVSLFTFCMVLGEICYEDDELSDKLESVIQITTDIVYENRQWFETNGEWDGFIKFFFPEDKLWKGFVLTTVGLGAVAGLLYANS